MNRRNLLGNGLGALVAAGLGNPAFAAETDAETVYELRTYHLNEGKEPVILERFRKEAPVFERSGMHAIGYWVPTDGPLAGKALIYILRHRSSDAAIKSWAKFRADPAFLQAKAESEKQGLVISSSESVFMKLADFSPKP